MLAAAGPVFGRIPTATGDHRLRRRENPSSTWTQPLLRDDTQPELGYARTSFARIAEHAGIGKSVISYHFASKDELLERVVESVCADGARFMAARLETETSPSARLGAYLPSNLEFIRDHRSEITAVTEIVVGVRNQEGALSFAGRPGGVTAAVKPLQEILRQGQDNGEFTAFDTATMAWSIRTLIDGVTRRRNLDSAFDFDTAIDEMVALVNRATRTSSP